MQEAPGVEVWMRASAGAQTHLEVPRKYWQSACQSATNSYSQVLTMAAPHRAVQDMVVGGRRCIPDLNVVHEAISIEVRVQAGGGEVQLAQGPP